MTISLKSPKITVIVDGEEKEFTSNLACLEAAEFLLNLHGTCNEFVDEFYFTGTYFRKKSLFKSPLFNADITHKFSNN